MDTAPPAVFGGGPRDFERAETFRSISARRAIAQGWGGRPKSFPWGALAGAALGRPRAPANRVDGVVVPFVFHASRPPTPRPGDEAARAFWAPLDGLPATLHKAVIELPEAELETPAFDAGGKPLWGFTFRVLCDLFDLVGWPQDAGEKPGPDRNRTWSRGAGGTP